MPRPKRIEDEAVMAAALEVLAERGMAFTLTDIAGRVGLSRAALIQRFGDREAILLAMARHEVAATEAWLASIPVETGPEALWRFLTVIVASMGEGGGFSARVAIAALEARDVELRRLAGRRYELVQAAIAARIPERADRMELAGHLHAVIAGATMQWVAAGEGALADYVLMRLGWAMRQLFPEIDIGR